MRIEPVDAHDDEAFAAWFATFDASAKDAWPDEPGWLPEELRAQATAPGGPHRLDLWAAYEADQVLGCVGLEFSLLDNRHLAMVTLDVHPAHRRHGVGTALLSWVEERARREGCTVVGVWQEDPQAHQEPVAGRAFAAARGYEMVLAMVRRDLDLPLDGAKVTDLEARCRPHALGYSIETFADRWPESDVSDRALMGRRMSTDAPVGEWEAGEEHWDTERVRSFEALVVAMGRRLVMAAARERSSGRLVAFSELAIPLRLPERAYQWDTLVLKEHRGHRLGTLVKLANLAVLAEASPVTKTVSTMNASQNDAMIAVNEALGCRVVSHRLIWQKTITTT